MSRFGKRRLSSKGGVYRQHVKLVGQFVTKGPGISIFDD